MNDAVLQKTPFGFDVSAGSFSGRCWLGIRLVMARPGGHTDPVYLIETIQQNKHHNHTFCSLDATGFSGVRQ